MKAACGVYVSMLASVSHRNSSFADESDPDHLTNKTSKSHWQYADLVHGEGVVEAGREGMLRGEAIVRADDGKLGTSSGGGNSAQLLVAST
jgi:hypothetical protein